MNTGAPVERSGPLGAEAGDDPQSADRYEGDVAFHTGLEPHRRAGGDVEPGAPGRLAVELQAGVAGGEVVVRADLDRPVGGVDDADGDALAARVERDGRVAVLDLTGCHRRSP